MNRRLGRSEEAVGVAHVPRTAVEKLRIDDVDIFYRCAGPESAPVVLLLHGLPSSSFMFRDLIPRLADHYRVIAPDYPAFGFSSQPDRETFAYTFDNLAVTIARFTEALGLERYSLYLQDYGGPVGLRLAMRHPKRVAAIIAQNIGLYDEGLRDPIWDEMKEIWADPTPTNRDRLRSAFTYEYTRFQWLLGAANPDRVPPETYTLDYALLRRPDTEDIQVDLLMDYGTEFDYFARYQTYLRTHRPPLLAPWGERDSYFTPVTLDLLEKDHPDAEVHLLPTGHFALESHVDEIAELIHEFLARRVA